MTSRAIPAAVLMSALALSACHTAVPPPPSQYGFAAAVAPLALRFAPGSTTLSANQVAALRALSAQIPANTVADFTVSGPPLRASAQRQAERVAHLLQRNLLVFTQATMPADEAVVSVPASSAITADACRRPAGRMTEDFWPGDDSRDALLLPPGCATALTIAAQTVSPSDLIFGRPLPPGAALPYAQAIERYYRRNDAPRPTGQSDQQGSGSEESGSAAGSAGGSGLAAAPAGNPLLGGVTSSSPGQTR